MKPIAFFAQRRLLQDRILGGMEHRFPPSPRLVAHATLRLEPLWPVLASLSFGVALILLALGFGSAGSALMIAPIWLLAALFVLFGLSFFTLLFGFARLGRKKLLPYRSGIYVYNASVIDLRDGKGRAFDCTELAQIDVDGSGLTMRVASGEVLRVAGESAVCMAAKTSLLHYAAISPEARLDEDPLHLPKFASPLGEGEPIKAESARWVSLLPAIVLVGAAAMATPLYFVRNSLSDASAFRSVRKTDSPEAYRAYLKGGRAHAEEVRKLLLPRAELRKLEAEQNTDALLAFAEEGERAAIADEVRAATRAAYERELAKAKATGKLSDLRAFSTKYPNHRLTREYTDAVHAVFERAATEHGGQATGGAGADEQARSAMRKLVLRAESHGPSLEIRVKRLAMPAFSKLDKSLAQVAEYMGEMSKPSKYFDEAGLSAHEKAVSARTLLLFQTKFPDEFVSPKLTEASGDGGDAAILSIGIGVEWSGKTFPMKKPRGVFVGITTHYDFELRSKTEGVMLRAKLDVVRSVPLALLRELETAPRSPPIEEKVYQTMLQESRSQLEAKLETMLFGKR
jgi:hypothetical protein